MNIARDLFQNYELIIFHVAGKSKIAHLIRRIRSLFEKIHFMVFEVADHKALADIQNGADNMLEFSCF